MKLAVNLINFGPSATPATLESWVDLAEGLGFHGLMTSDHVTVTEDVHERYPAPFYEPLSTLGWLAARTRRVAIGTTVSILPYRSPLETARAFANVDQLSGGRVILGVGIGWAEQEFAALGVPFRRRGRITDDYLTAILALWGSDVASHEGEFVSFRNVHSAPRPLQTPRPPVWVGGNSEAAMRRALRFATAWHPLRLRPHELGETLRPMLRTLAVEASQPVPEICPRIRLRVTERPAPDETRLAGEGSLEQIRADLEELESEGCTWVLLDTYHDYHVEELRHPEQHWSMYQAVAAHCFDLAAETAG